MRVREARRARSAWTRSLTAHGMQSTSCARGEVGVQAPQPGGRRRPRVPARAASRRRRHRSAVRRVGEQLRRRRAANAVGSRSSTRKPVRAVVDERAQTADGGRHDRGPARRRLERDEPERLRPARHDAHVGGAVVGRRAGGAAAGSTQRTRSATPSSSTSRVRLGRLGLARRRRSGRRRRRAARVVRGRARPARRRRRRGP